MREPRPKKDLVGTQYDYITVLTCTPETGRGGYEWKCRCICGKSLVLSTQQIRARSPKSCGCQTRNIISESKLGPNNPNWKGGISKRQQTEGKTWRRKVYKRDNWTCQICQARSKRGKHVDLNAHHLDAFHWNTEKRDQLNNGITLCVDCHYEFHFKYGNQNNTKNEFIKFCQQKKSELKEDKIREVRDLQNKINRCRKDSSLLPSLLQQARQTFLLSDIKLSKKIGVYPSSVTRWRNNKQQCKKALTPKILDVLETESEMCLNQCLTRT